MYSTTPVASLTVEEDVKKKRKKREQVRNGGELSNGPWRMAKWQLGEPCQTAAKAVATNYNYIMRNIRIKGPRKKDERERKERKEIRILTKILDTIIDVL